MTSPGCSTWGAVRRTPLTKVPLALPRSWMTNCVPSQVRLAWRRETSPWLTTTSLPASRPMMMVGLVKEKRWPGWGPWRTINSTEGG